VSHRPADANPGLQITVVPMAIPPESLAARLSQLEERVTALEARLASHLIPNPEEPR